MKSGEATEGVRVWLYSNYRVYYMSRPCQVHMAVEMALFSVVSHEKCYILTNDAQHFEVVCFTLFKCTAWWAKIKLV